MGLKELNKPDIAHASSPSSFPLRGFLACLISRWPWFVSTRRAPRVAHNKAYGHADEQATHSCGEFLFHSAGIPLLRVLRVAGGDEKESQDVLTLWQRSYDNRTQ